LGTKKDPGEGPRLGTVRRPPRGVAKKDYARLDYFDVWLPELAPSAGLVTWASTRPWTRERWNTFARRYRAEMKRPQAQRLLATLAALSSAAEFSIGCYCADEAHCHRTLLRDLLREAGAKIHHEGKGA
jgi:uncharacterized protein YeaO (DUF488 family)